MIGDSNEFLDIKQSALDKDDYYVGTPVKLGLSPVSECSKI